jgi:thiamine pyrophosphokinase
MRRALVLAGDLADDPACQALLDQAELIICADGGARHLRRLGKIPHLAVGDFDSISAEDLAWLRAASVPLCAYPAAKNETDGELALRAALVAWPEPKGDHELIVLGALGGRPDHALANQMLAASLAAEGYRLLLTDGISRVYTLTVGQVLTLDLPRQPAAWVVSAIPLSDTVTGLTYTGLVYPLQDATLRRGSTRGISNRFRAGQAATASLTDGLLLVFVTPDDQAVRSGRTEAEFPADSAKGGR